MNLNDFPSVNAVNTDLNLSTQFYQLLTDPSKYVLKRIQILPQEMVNENPDIQHILNETGLRIASIDDDLTGFQEVVLSDNIMSKMFIECYCALYLKPTPIEQLLIPAIVILMITPNDTTAIKKLWQLIRRMDDKKQLLSILFLLGGYLSCNYDKTNKSSCLWTLFKKLLVRIKEDGFEYNPNVNLKIKLKQWKLENCDDDLLYYSIKVCLRSVSEHPRNYYATSALRFLLSRYNENNIEVVCFEIAKEAAIMNYDISLWKVMCDLLLNSSTKSLNFCREEAIRFSSMPVVQLKKTNISPKLAEMIVTNGSKELLTYMIMLIGNGEVVEENFKNTDTETLKEIIRRQFINYN